MAKEYIFKAMGSLAYAVAVADGTIQEEEKKTIKKLALEEFEIGDIDNAWITNMFTQLEERKISAEEAYQYALDSLEASRFSYDFDDAMKKKCLRFIERTAESHQGVDYSERAILNRLKKDLARY